MPVKDSLEAAREILAADPDCPDRHGHRPGPGEDAAGFDRKGGTVTSARRKTGILSRIVGMFIVVIAVIGLPR
jgi:hypothetical protein